MTEREKIAARIRALLEKTVENGCTEAEALAAAKLAADLLAKYNLSLDEVQMRASPFERHRETHDDPVGERMWKVADAIAKLTGAVYWVSRPGVVPIEINFFGFAHEVDVARYLLEICARAMRQQHRRLKQDWALVNAATQRRKILPFLDGMADRLRQRILELVPSKPTGTGLVVLRGELINAAMDVAGLKTETGRGRSSRADEEGYRHGRRAADQVALNKGLGGTAGQAKGMLR